MDPVRNPYAPGAGTPPPELAGRIDIIKDARTALRRAAQGRPVQSQILVGLRGVGKTVLLNHFLDIAATEKQHSVFVEAHEGRTLPEMLLPGIRGAFYSISSVAKGKHLAMRGLRVLRSFVNGLKLSVDGVDIGLSIAPETGTADTGDLEADLPRLFETLGEAAKAAGKPVVVFIDELQYFTEKEFSALIMAIHRVNQRSLPVLLIGAGLPQILALAGGSKSYAERLFKFPRIGALAIDDAISALEKPAQSEGVHFERGAVTQIIRATESYPYFLQQWAHEAWNVASEGIIRTQDVYAAQKQAIQRLDESFFRVRFDRCTPSEKLYMRALAELGAGQQRSGDIASVLLVKTTSIAPTRSNLIKKGMIYAPAYGDTAFTVPMFDQYMKRAIPTLPNRRRKV